MSFYGAAERRRLREKCELRSAERRERVAAVFDEAGPVPDVFGELLNDDGSARYYADGDGCWGVVAHTNGIVRVTRWAKRPPSFGEVLARGDGVTVEAAHREAMMHAVCGQPCVCADAARRLDEAFDALVHDLRGDMPGHGGW